MSTLYAALHKLNPHRRAVFKELLKWFNIALETNTLKAVSEIHLLFLLSLCTATENSDIDLLVDTTSTKLTSLFSLGKLYCELEDALGKNIDLITVSALTQREQMPSDKVFRETILNERVDIYVAA